MLAGHRWMKWDNRLKSSMAGVLLSFSASMALMMVAPPNRPLAAFSTVLLCLSASLLCLWLVLWFLAPVRAKVSPASLVFVWALLFFFGSRIAFWRSLYDRAIQFHGFTLNLGVLRELGVVVALVLLRRSVLAVVGSGGNLDNDDPAPPAAGDLGHS